MEHEIGAIEKNQTWELCDLPTGAKDIGVKWIYKTKLNRNGEIDNWWLKDTQKYGIDYTEFFAPVARWDTIRVVLPLAAQKGTRVHHLDVKSAFLHDDLSETVYVQKPQGFEQVGKEEKVYKLKNALYRLKQAPRAWHSRIKSYFMKSKFQKCPHFVKDAGEGKMLIVSLYVDDLMVAGTNMLVIEEFKSCTTSEFDMSDLGEMSYFLGVEVIQNDRGIYLCQRKYARDVLERMKLEHCNPFHSPIVPGSKLVKEDGSGFTDAYCYRQMVGCLMYLAATRLDLMYVISIVSRYLERPTNQHMAAIKRVLRYVKGTVNYGIHYKKNGSSILTAYSDSDYAGDVDSRKSTSGYLFFLGDASISWSSKRQPVATLSTTETEFVSAAACACQVIWLRRVYCDIVSTIKLLKNLVVHKRSVSTST